MMLLRLFDNSNVAPINPVDDNQGIICRGVVRSEES